MSEAKKITAAERKVAKAMLLALEYANEHPEQWHEIGPYAADQKAVEMLQARGVVEVDGTRYRIARDP